MTAETSRFLSGKSESSERKLGAGRSLRRYAKPDLRRGPLLRDITAATLSTSR